MLGNIFLTIAIFACFFSSGMYYYTYRGKTNTLQLARISYYLMTLATFGASIVLLHLILTHQFQYEYVYNYTSTTLPKSLLISTFFAGQTGSLLLWAFFMSIVGLFLISYTSQRKTSFEPYVMAIFTLATLFLLVMINPLFKNPFSYIGINEAYISLKHINQQLFDTKFLKDFIFTDTKNNTSYLLIDYTLLKMLAAKGISISNFIIEGKGLNPLLQNFWMQIHPPILFLGFTLSTVPFAFAIAGLLKNDFKEWLVQSFPWLTASTAILGLAIMLGGYWAYGVLGWGGYWGWDPVENSGLVPFLLGVAAIHTFVIQKRNQEKKNKSNFIRLNFFLSVLIFISVLYSTFLTRSGILGDASVHSFVGAGKTVYLFLILFILVFSFIGFGTIFQNWKKLQQVTEQSKNFLSREMGIFSATLILTASAIIITAGNSMPIFKKSVETEFYKTLHFPILILSALFSGISLYLKWEATETKRFIKNLTVPFITSFILALVLSLLINYYNLIFIISIFVLTFSLIVNIKFLLQTFNGRKLFLGSYISHVGMGVFLLGVIFTTYLWEEKQVELEKNISKKVFDYSVEFAGYTQLENEEKFAFPLKLKKENSEYKLSPIMINISANSVMREPDILSNFFYDFYISPVNYKEGRFDTKKIFTLGKGSSINYDSLKITFEGFEFKNNSISSMKKNSRFEIGAKLKLEIGGKIFAAIPIMKFVNNEKLFTSVNLKEANLIISLKDLDASGFIEIEISKIFEEQKIFSDAEVFTIHIEKIYGINLVWAGVGIMFLGLFISVIKRAKEIN